MILPISKVTLLCRKKVTSVKLVNQQLIKDTNLKLLYNYIFDNRGISRARLAVMSKLSKTTVSTLIDELIDRKFIVDLGAADSSAVGRKPNSLHINANTYYVIVINWEEKQIVTHMVDIAGSVVYKNTTCLTTPEDNYVSLSKTAIYEDILNRTSMESILGICIVVSAMIDQNHNEIYSTTLALPDKNHVDFIETLKVSFKEFPVALLNDTACYAYAEKAFTQITQEDFAFININKGVGATLFIRGEMLGPADGGSTQFGHYSVDPNGKPCICGNKGCLELMIGENSLKERITKMGGSPALNHLDYISFHDLGKASLFGDLVAQKAIKDIGEEFTYALANLICIVHPRLVIIGGKSKHLGSVFLENIINNLRNNGFQRMVENLELRYTYLDEDAYLNGAMKYFFDIHYRLTQELNGTFFIG